MGPVKTQRETTSTAGAWPAEAAWVHTGPEAYSQSPNYATTGASELRGQAGLVQK